MTKLKKMIEDKVFKTIIILLVCVLVLGLGFAMIKFLPPALKLLGGIANIVSVWLFIKYLRKEFFNKK